jgi:hypothetical protein
MAHKEKSEAERSEKIKRPMNVEKKNLKTSETIRSWPKVTAGVAVAGGAGLLAVSLLGAAPVAVAGVAGYLAYCGMKGKKPLEQLGENDEIGV